MDTLQKRLRPDDTLRIEVRTAADILRNGGIVSIPTDTVYGLAASPFSEKAVARLFAIKGRPRDMALPLLLADYTELLRCAYDIPELAWELAEEFWPGALTLVLRKAGRIPDTVSGGRQTIAVRVPNHEVPRAIARELGGPITGTSANRTGRPAPTTADGVRDELGHAIDMLIDGGRSDGGLPSTVLDVSGGQPRILRDGAVSAARIQETYGRTVLQPE